MDDQRDPVQAQCLDEAVDVADVVLEAVADVGLVRFAEADQVRRDAAGATGDMRNDVAPQVGGCRIAVQEQHYLVTVRGGAGIDVVHTAAEHLDMMGREIEARADWLLHVSFPFRLLQSDTAAGVSG